MTKKRKVVLSIAVMSIFSIAFLLILDYDGIFKKNPNDDKYISEQINNIKNYWEIEINNKYDVIYHEISDVSFRGDGLKYFVLRLNDNDQINTISLNQTENKSFENECIAAIDLENKSLKLPDFNKKYSWSKIDKNNDTLFLLYYPDNLELYILESRI